VLLVSCYRESPRINASVLQGVPYRFICRQIEVYMYQQKVTRSISEPKYASAEEAIRG